jgi:hypothetical protein
MQANTSALSAETTRKAAFESQWLSMEMERETRQRELDRARVEVEKRRAKTEEDREARLQRKDEREAKLEELRIEAQQAQQAYKLEELRIEAQQAQQASIRSSSSLASRSSFRWSRASRSSSVFALVAHGRKCGRHYNSELKRTPQIIQM